MPLFKFAPRQRLFFVHIPKTAGTSVEQSLKQLYGRRASPAYRDANLLLTPPRLLRAWRFYSGHVYYDTRSILKPDTAIVTFVRDPLARALSVYNWVKENPAVKLHQKVGDLDFMDWVRDENYNSHLLENQVRYLGVSVGIARLRALFLANELDPAEATKQLEQARRVRLGPEHLARAKQALSSMALVGQVERFDESLAMLFTQVLGLPAPTGQAIRSNITRQPRLTAGQMNEDDRAEFRECAAAEYELVDFAREISNRQLDAIPSGAGHA